MKQIYQTFHMHIKETKRNPYGIPFRKRVRRWNILLAALLLLQTCIGCVSRATGAEAGESAELSAVTETASPWDPVDGAICYVNQTGGPSVSAASAVLIEARSGVILFEKDAYTPRGMASTTKIMTALTAIRNADVGSLVTVPSKAVGVEGSSVYLHEGEQLTMEQLLYAMLLESANDAAETIAIAVSGSVSEFADLMNRTALSFGIRDTNFTNPHGLYNEAHMTSAYSLALITRQAMGNPIFREIVSTYKKKIPLDGDTGTRVLVNHNKLLLNYQGAVGVKTGFTKSTGRCLVSAAERDGLCLIAVTLNAPDDWTDHTAMLDYGFANYRRVGCDANTLTGEIGVAGGSKETVAVTNPEAGWAVVPRNCEVTMRMEKRQFCYAPVEEGEAVGCYTIYADGEAVAEIVLRTMETVPVKEDTGGFFIRFWRRICGTRNGSAISGD